MSPQVVESLRVESLLNDTTFDLRLELVAGRPGLGRRIVSSRIQKPGLALAGFTAHIHRDRLAVFGNTEMSYLATLSHEAQARVCDQLCALDLSCLVVTKSLEIPAVLVDAAQRRDMPLMRSSHLSSTFIDNIERCLQEALTQSTSLHGVLVDVLGVGVLILGKSGIGKSECALDLVVRGHRLVADDIVNIKRKPGGPIYGSGSEIIGHHMEIRGLGIINIKDLFGISSVRERKKLELVVELMDWDERVEYDRLGIEDQKYRILDVEVPLMTIPVRPGRNLTTIIEVAARNHLLKEQGHHSAREFQERLNRQIAQTRTRRGLGDDVE
jgi:HPr kinase/phosphorylase